MSRFENIVLNVPHSSNCLPCNSGWSNLAELDKEIRKWTDWHTNILFNPSKELRSKIIPCSFEYSRFYVDVERLEYGPLEKIGQGIVYTDFNELHRDVDDFLREHCMRLYESYISRLACFIEKNTLLIDCHSFPSDLSDVDICIGFNDNNSKPKDEDIEYIKDLFSSHGYKVGINDPYSNSITPKSKFDYKSIMIEVNKRCYMNENTLALNADYYKIGNLIQKMYRHFLGEE